MLVTCNKNSTDKTTENSDNVIDMTIQNNNKEPLKNKKNTNKNFADSKTLNTTDNFTSRCFEHPTNEKYKSQNGKNTSEANDNIDILMISETKLDPSFPIGQFQIHGFSEPYRFLGADRQP